MKRNVRFTAWWPTGQAVFFATCDILDPAVLQARGCKWQAIRLAENDYQRPHAVACPEFFRTQTAAENWYFTLDGNAWKPLVNEEAQPA